MRERLKNSVEKCELNFFSDKIMHKISSRYLFFSFFPALLHCSLLLLLLNTLAQSLEKFIYIFIYIYKYNSTKINDDKTFSFFFFLLSVSFNRKRRERSHQSSINQIRKVISKSKSPTHLNKQDINKYVSTNNV